MKVFSRRILLLVFAFIFAFSAYKAGRLLYHSHKEDKAFEALYDEVKNKKLELYEIAEMSEETEEASAYTLLKEKNPDYFGWLTIPDTRLDYPVMYTPDEPEYYIHRAFDGSYSYSGVPFVGEGWNKDNRHTIIYGHNMKNGSMFAELLSYRERSFCKEHPEIILDIEDGMEVYSVIGAFYSEAYTEADEGMFRYYQCNSLKDENDFWDYVANVKKAALYDTGVEVEDIGKIITLSTCSYHKDNGRFVVVGYKK